MIISASRRTDIPAFYADWLLTRIREGYVFVRNPMQPRKISRVSLSPDVVDGLVLWTKNPLPMLGRLREQDDRLYYSISATTRAPRPGETDGVQYYFLTREDFEQRIAQNAFLEHARYVDNYYGTLEAPVNQKLDEGYDVILEIEVQGAMQVHKKRPDAVMVFIAPPSFEELAARLRGRGTEDEEKVMKRLETAKEELKHQDEFDYVVINDEIDRAVEELKGILAARRA